MNCNEARALLATLGDEPGAGFKPELAEHCQACAACAAEAPAWLLLQSAWAAPDPDEVALYRIAKHLTDAGLGPTVPQRRPVRLGWWATGIAAVAVLGLVTLNRFMPKDVILPEPGKDGVQHATIGTSPEGVESARPANLAAPVVQSVGMEYSTWEHTQEWEGGEAVFVDIRFEGTQEGASDAAQF